MRVTRLEVGGADGCERQRGLIEPCQIRRRRERERHLSATARRRGVDLPARAVSQRQPRADLPGVLAVEGEGLELVGEPRDAGGEEQQRSVAIDLGEAGKDRRNDQIGRSEDRREPAVIAAELELVRTAGVGQVVRPLDLALLILDDRAGGILKSLASQYQKRADSILAPNPFGDDDRLRRQNAAPEAVEPDPGETFLPAPVQAYFVNQFIAENLRRAQGEKFGVLLIRREVREVGRTARFRRRSRAVIPPENCEVLIEAVVEADAQRVSVVGVGERRDEQCGASRRALVVQNLRPVRQRKGIQYLTRHTVRSVLTRGERRHGRGDGRLRQYEPLALVRDEEERLVTPFPQCRAAFAEPRQDDRPAERPAEVVVTERRLAEVKEVACVERVVAEVFEERAVVVVLAGARQERNLPTRLAPELRRERGRQDRKLLQRVYRSQVREPALDVRRRD